MNKPEATEARKILSEVTHTLLGDTGDTARLEIIPVCRRVKTNTAAVYMMLLMNRLGVLG